MKLPNLAEIQNLPFHVRVRILWIVGIIVVVIVGGAWIISAQEKASQANPSEIVDIIKPGEENEKHYVTIERVERKQGKLHVYFKVTNPTGNILNFSQNIDTTLTEGQNAPVNAEQIADRQGIVFFFKILSHSEKYGVATFPDVRGNEAVIKFSNLFLEGSESGFTEAFELDLNELSKPLQPRS